MSRSSDIGRDWRLDVPKGTAVCILAHASDTSGLYSGNEVVLDWAFGRYCDDA